MKNKEIKFWLSRVNEEYIKQVMNLLTQINTHNYQIVNFDYMREEVQEDVVEQLILNMQHLGWNKESQELKEGIK